MRVPVKLTRILIFLLAFRVVAAPVSFHSTKACLPLRSYVVMRTRCWPPQRLQRFSAASKLLQLFQGRDKTTPAVPDSRLCLRTLTPADRHSLSFDSHTSPDSAQGRPTDHLRC